MTSVNTTPFANLYTDSTGTELRLYCDKLSYEKEDVLKLQVGEIEFRKNESLSRHEYLKFSISYQGSVVGYAVMEQGVDIENRSRSPSELSLKRPASPRNLLRSSVSTQSISVSSSNDFSAKDTIRVFKDKAAADHFLAKSCSLSTLATSTSAVNSSFARLVVLGIAINDVIPKYHLFSTNCYYSVALMLDLMEDDKIIGGRFTPITEPKMGKNGPVRTVDRDSVTSKEAVAKVKEALMEKWDGFIITRTSVTQYNVLKEEHRKTEELRRNSEISRKNPESLRMHSLGPPKFLPQETSVEVYFFRCVNTLVVFALV